MLLEKVKNSFETMNFKSHVFHSVSLFLDHSLPIVESEVVPLFFAAF